MTDEEILDLWDEVADYKAYVGDIERFARAVIARAEKNLKEELREAGDLQ